jgi:hypothetical protein
MLGAKTMAVRSACRAISAFWAASKPVVPTTALTPSSAHRARCVSVDQHVGAGEAGAQVVVASERRMQLAVVGRLDGFDEHLAHAPAGAHDGDPNHVPGPSLASRGG